MTEESEKNIRIPHRQSGDYSSHYASGAALSGPTPDGNFHIIFWNEAIKINAETGVLLNSSEQGNQYQTEIRPEDSETYREDVARISMSAPALRGLLEMIAMRISSPDK